MQSLQADQSLYNRKGVCYISLSIGHFSGVKNTSILNRDRKYNKNINNSGQNQRKTSSYHPQIEKTRIPGPGCLTYVLKREKRSCGDVGTLSLKSKKGGFGRPGNLIHEGDSHLTNLKSRKRG